MPPLPRPFVRLNYAMTADGKITSADRTWSGFGSRRDRDRMDALRAEADAILIGAGTLRADDPPMHVKDATRREARAQRGLPPQPRRAVLSASLDLPIAGRFFSGEGERPFVLTVGKAAAAPLARLEGKAEIIQAGTDRVDLRRALAELRERGIQSLLVEGGGEVNAAFLEAGLVDELFMTLCPLLAGGVGTPTPAGGPGFPRQAMPRLELLASEQAGDEIFCRYAVAGAAQARTGER